MFRRPIDQKDSKQTDIFFKLYYQNTVQLVKVESAYNRNVPETENVFYTEICLKIMRNSSSLTYSKFFAM